MQGRSIFGPDLFVSTISYDPHAKIISHITEKIITLQVQEHDQQISAEAEVKSFNVWSPKEKEGRCGIHTAGSSVHTKTSIDFFKQAMHVLSELMLASHCLSVETI